MNLRKVLPTPAVFHATDKRYRAAAVQYIAIDARLSSYFGFIAEVNFSNAVYA